MSDPAITPGAAVPPEAPGVDPGDGAGDGAGDESRDRAGGGWPRRYQVTHRTEYTYGTSVSDAYSVACLLPRTRPTQHVLQRDLFIEPEPNEYDDRRDVFGNHVTQVGVHRPHDAFSITSMSIVEVDRPVAPTSSSTWEDVAARAASLRGPAAVAVGPYRALTAATTPASRRDLLDELATRVFRPGRPLVEAIGDLNHTIFTEWTFDPTATDLATPLDAVLEQRRGVCQDFAHLAIAAMRSVGLAASYISGYIETDPPPGEEKSIGADASHAWCSVWIPDDSTLGHDGAAASTNDQAGGMVAAARQRRWFDLDPTNDQFPPSRHVTVGWGRDYADVAPLRGVVIGASAHQRLEVAVDVHRLT